MRDITIIQEAVYEFIKEHLINNHSTPTLKEITAQMGWASINSAAGHIKALGKKGYLEMYEDGSGKYRLKGIKIKLKGKGNVRTHN